MRILGIDPGSRATGFGVVDLVGSRLQRVASGVIRPRCDSLAGRLAGIFAELGRVIEQTQPTQAALEAVFVARNVRSALLLGQARGAALTACAVAGLEAAECAPSEVKLAVAGYGAASKEQVQTMVARLLGLSACPAADEADALAIAICHGHASRGRAALVSRGAAGGRSAPEPRT